MKITSVGVFQIDLPPQTVRTDVIQAFTTQETVFCRIRDDGS